MSAPAQCMPSTANPAFTSAPRTGGDPYQPELRHPTSSLPLLPSGPDGIHDWSSRRSRYGPPQLKRRAVTEPAFRGAGDPTTADVHWGRRATKQPAPAIYAVPTAPGDRLRPRASEEETLP